jgi:opacity protein-like surface antigen
LFARVDSYDPNTHLGNDGNTMVIAGVECAPVKGVKASLNYRNTGYQDDETTSLKYVYLNTEFKF